MGINNENVSLPLQRTNENSCEVCTTCRDKPHPLHFSLKSLSFSVCRPPPCSKECGARFKNLQAKIRRQSVAHIGEQTRQRHKNELLERENAHLKARINEQQALEESRQNVCDVLNKICQSVCCICRESEPNMIAPCCHVGMHAGCFLGRWKVHPNCPSCGRAIER
jgi:hypothetical protein